jgi:cyclase
MNRRLFLAKSAALGVSGLLLRRPVLAQAAWGRGAAAPTAVAFTPIRRGVGMFTGRGGAIGWLSNAEALVAVDTQFADTAEQFLAGLPGREGRMLDLVINTHHHGDHTGGNATFRGATRSILGHANVPELMRSGGGRGAPATPPVVPDTTFTESWRREIGDEVITARYFGAAHTRGDIVTHFEQANVIHLGDLAFNRVYPVIDRNAGGTFQGWLSVLERIAAEYPADTTYIFGHSHASDSRYTTLGTRADLLRFRDYVSALLEHTRREIAAGRSREQIVELQNLPEFEDYHVEGNSRLPGNLGAAFDELTS